MKKYKYKIFGDIAILFGGVKHLMLIENNYVVQWPITKM